MKHIYGKAFKTIIFCGLIALLAPYSLFSQTYQGIPYYNGFESTTLGPEWTTASSQTTGEIDVFASGYFTWNSNSADAYAGNYFMGMHNAQPAGGFNLNTADLHLDAAGQSGLRFNFWWAEWNDETHVEDGVFISDDGGVTFTKVIDFEGGSTSDLEWQYFDFDLDSINNQHGLTFNSTYIIRFQQYDDYYFAGGNDGMLFDEINVFEPCNTTSSITEVVCSSYTVPSGDETYTISGIYNDTIPNTANCDSIITINLTVNETTASINETVCDSYTVPSGDETYTTSGVYNDTIPNTANCDSIITINLTVNQTTASINETVCDSYTVPSGDETYTSSGIYNDTIPNAASCDSIITINLTVYQAATSSFNASACGSYEWTSGNVYTSSGTYTQTFQTTNGCDSVVTLDLTILEVPAMTISSTNGADLMAVGNADSLAWVDCDDATIESTGQAAFTPSSNGNYAVIGINDNGCVDTSDCYQVQNLKLDDFNEAEVSLYPNPTEEIVNIKIPFQYERILIVDLSGRVVMNIQTTTINISSLDQGTYFVKIIGEQQKNIETISFVKN